MNIEKILDEVYKLNEDENILPLTKLQVVNVLNRLLVYPIETEQQFKTALEYSVKMRSEILFCTNHIMPPYKGVYNYYTNIDYVIYRVLRIMKIVNDEYRTEPSYEDNVIDNIKIRLNMIEQDLKEEVKTKIKIKEK